MGKGCLLWGGVLGVVVGLSFAFYGLGPILRHFYGETQVSVGGTYEGGGLTIRVVDVLDGNVTYSGATLVQLAVTGDRERGWSADEFRLQLTGIEEWRTPLNSPIQLPGTGEAKITLDFGPLEGAQPEALHLTSPRVRFALR